MTLIGLKLEQSVPNKYLQFFLPNENNFPKKELKHNFVFPQNFILLHKTWQKRLLGLEKIFKLQHIVIPTPVSIFITELSC